MISERDRRVLDGIERDVRATDPELCERLSRLEHPPSAVRRTVDRLVGTRAILGWCAALAGALLLELPGVAMLLFVIVIACLSVRTSRMQTHLPESATPWPPFGRSPDGFP